MLYQERESQATPADVAADDLWLTTAELTRVSGWELKPEGICKDEICVPVPEARRAALIRGATAEPVVNLTEFARLIEQPYAHDKASRVWYFGPPGWEWKDRFASRQAPDFSLPDLDGQVHTLSELRGNKVFLLFWATW